MRIKRAALSRDCFASKNNASKTMKESVMSIPIAYCLVVVLCSLAGSANAAWFGKPKDESERIYRIEFVKAMEEAEDAKREAEHRKSLTDRILALAQKVSSGSGRRMEDENQYYKYEDVNDWNAVENMAGMAIKYTGCQNIQRWDDTMAAGGESPFLMDRFVMFRLCDANKCSSYNKWGCNSNYGEYVIPMEDYLSLMADYHFQQYSRYCQTCYLCSKLDYYKVTEDEDATQQGVDDDTVNITEATYDDDAWSGYRQYWYEPDYWEDDDYNGNRRRTGYSYYQQGGGAANYYYGDSGYNFTYGDYMENKWYEDANTGKCVFEEVCTNYRGACKSYNPNATFYESYFTCSSFTVGSTVGYLAPHCRSDGHTIGIGLYSDSYCSNYTGDESKVQEFTGQTFDDGELTNYYDKNCIPCHASEGFSLITDDALSANEDLTYPLCSVLYESSAKCNKHASDTLTYNDDETNQEMNEETVCGFLESMNEHSYTEYGQIYLASNDLGEWFEDPRASLSQKMLLLVSMAAFTYFAVYSVYLTKKLIYRKPWRPPRNVHSPYSSGASDAASAYAVSEVGRASRARSGILSLRSGEGASYLRDPWGDHDNYSKRTGGGTFA
mmetsp:Transcript_3694/g.4920  ORF Transcript_3694/g.4920 Transcript_3694/m.4920 type:complete len:611 (+) Transcript_3694:31-1863(+)